MFMNTMALPLPIPVASLAMSLPERCDWCDAIAAVSRLLRIGKKLKDKFKSKKLKKRYKDYVSVSKYVLKRFNKQIRSHQCS